MNKRQKIKQDLEIFFQSPQMKEWENAKNNASNFNKNLYSITTTILMLLLLFFLTMVSKPIVQYFNNNFITMIITMVITFICVFLLPTIMYFLLLKNWKKFHHYSILTTKYNDLKKVYEGYVQKYPNELIENEMKKNLKYTTEAEFLDSKPNNDANSYIDFVIIEDELTFEIAHWNLEEDPNKENQTLTEEIKYTVVDVDKINSQITIKNDTESKIIHYENVSNGIYKIIK